MSVNNTVVAVLLTEALVLLFFYGGRFVGVKFGGIYGFCCGWVGCVGVQINCRNFISFFSFSSSLSAIQERRTPFYQSGQYSSDTSSLVASLPSFLGTIFFHFLQIHQRKLSLRNPASWISQKPTWHWNYQPFNILSWVNQKARHFPHHTKLSLWWLHYLCQLSIVFFCFLSFSFNVNHLPPIYLADKVLKCG